MARKIGILVSLSFILGLWFWLDTPVVHSNIVKVLSIKDSSIGNIEFTDSYEGKFILQNNGTDTIAIEDIDASCSCLVAHKDTLQIMPYGTVSIPYKLSLSSLIKNDAVRNNTLRLMVYIKYRIGETKGTASFFIEGSIANHMLLSCNYLYIHGNVVNGALSCSGNVFTIYTDSPADITISCSPPILRPAIKSQQKTSHSVTLTPNGLSNDVESGFITITAKDKTGNTIAKRNLDFKTSYSIAYAKPECVHVDAFAPFNQIIINIRSDLTSFCNHDIDCVSINNIDITNCCVFSKDTSGYRVAIKLNEFFKNRGFSSLTVRMRHIENGEQLSVNTYLLH